jgi:transcriptional/translational regulatory protein YebC/TACO1
MGRAYQNRKESMAKTAATKTAVYSRYSREIYMAAKGGGYRSLCKPDTAIAD